jgi:acetyl esterase/lipase
MAVFGLCICLVAADKNAASSPALHGVRREPFVIPLHAGAGMTSRSAPDQETEYGEPPIKLVRNVVTPTLTAFLPAPSRATGTAVIVAPGGAFIMLAVVHEGEDVARWLADRGIAAFVLRYRLALTPRSDADFRAMRARQLRDPAELQPIFKAQAPISIADGKDAIGLVRQRAAEWGINVDRIGILGFSAGGEVATGAAIGYGVDNRPNFAAPIYGAAADGNIPSDAPPVFIAAADDDPSVPANTSVQLYSRWVAAGRSAELHIYSKGGHGFGMRRQGTPTDGWIDAFYTWLIAEGFAK